MERGSYPSRNGLDKIEYYVYKPAPEDGGSVAGSSQSAPENGPQKPLAILQISHGMCEYLQRYGDFAEYLNRRGILVCGNDHLGHGDSVESEEGFGYFAAKDGWKYLIEDVRRLTLKMKGAYPDTPYFLLGHSMGSFVVRAYLAKYGDELSGAVLMGTSGTNRSAGLAVPLVQAIKKVRGGRYRSPLIQKLAFGTYNTKFKPRRTEYDWISADEGTVDEYNADKRCTFIFTLDGFLDLFHLLKYISGEKWAKQVSVDLPVILMSGDLDPVGDCGKGVKEVHDNLALAGVKDLIVKLYPECRHEILNERNKERVYEDVYQWMKKRI